MILQSTTVRSPAKINLFLEVCGRRADSFHELQTVMARTDFCDVLRFTARDDDEIVLSLRQSPSIADRRIIDFPLDENNLIARAARALCSRAGVTRGADIVVQKNIPSEAGLGGGSGNAAVTLRTLNQLWGVHLPDAALHEVAASLGSDINFLLNGCRVGLCTGRGQHVTPLCLRSTLHGVLVLPFLGNSTADVFQCLRPTNSMRSVDSVRAALKGGNRQQIKSATFNRLQQAAIEVNPTIGRTLRILQNINGQAIVTGTGSACYSLTKSHCDSQRIVRYLMSRSIGQVLAFRC
ncbi:MAG: 4-(cytidine 5'-diphospho)-2-C-methyl-D-erythritol kinase [Fuerstiella sp.]|nr:4-(cytidine 5'-diphospho)-2-C-methyl-D-erythritol kinase [Fuerstiella sp.]